MAASQEALFWKRELESYNFISQQIEKNIVKLDQMQFVLNGVHGIDYSKVRVQVHYDGKPDSYYNLLEKKDALMKATRLLQDRKEEIDGLLEAMEEEERAVITQRFIERRKLRKMGDEMGYEPNGMYSRIISIITKAIKKRG